MTCSSALRLTGLLAAVAATAALPGPAVAAEPVTPSQATLIGTQAYLYGFPLLEFVRVRATQTSVACPDEKGNAPVNAFSSVTRFANPSTRTVVAPNVDALYSSAQLDLGKGPVVLSHPDMGSRYFVLQLLDAYTNTPGYIGTRTTGSRAARFQISWSGRPGRRIPGVKRITVPTQRIWVLGRTLATDRADQRRAIGLMRRYRLTPPGGARRFADDCRPGTPRKATTPDGLAFLRKLNAALADNPPPARDEPVLAQLATAGVGPGLDPRKAGLSPAAYDALLSAVEATAAGLPAGARSTVLQTALAHGGWATPPSVIGNYGTDYRNRAGVAEIGLGANTPEEALYPTAYADADGEILDGANDYRMTFAPGQAPPARAFWSLTVYDEDGDLVENPTDRYAIGSSHLPLVKRSDGTIVVVISRRRPTERGVNWLPTPDGVFRLNMRLYWPSQAALSGEWLPPAIRRVAG